MPDPQLRPGQVDVVVRAAFGGQLQGWHPPGGLLHGRPTVSHLHRHRDLVDATEDGPNAVPW